jgi:hypothetical protein
MLVSNIYEASEIGNLTALCSGRLNEFRDGGNFDVFIQYPKSRKHLAVTAACTVNQTVSIFQGKDISPR